MRISKSERQAFAQALRELADDSGEEIRGRANRLRVDEVGDYTIFCVGSVLAMEKAGCCGDEEDANGYLASLADIVEGGSVD